MHNQCSSDFLWLRFFSINPMVSAEPIAHDGVPAAEIILEGDAAPLKYAAEELQTWTGRISGAELPILTQASQHPLKTLKIYLGTPETSPTIRTVVEKSYAADLAKLKGNDGFAIRQQGSNIYIFASEPKGILNGVYRFLDRNSDIIFVRALQGEEGFGTIYSKNPNLSADNVDLLEVPAFRMRGLQGDPAWGARLLTRNRTNLPGQPDTKAKLDRFGTVYAYSAHGVQPNEFKDNPGFFAMVGGKRGNSQYYTQLCYTNPELASVYMERLKSAAAANPAATSFDAQHADNWRVCECPVCTQPYKLPDGSTIAPNDPAFRSTIFFDFTNRAATMLKNEFPGQNKEVLALAYVWSNPAPKIKLSDNLAVHFAPFVRDQRHPIFHPVNTQWHKSIEQWMQQHKNIELFEYYFSTTLPWFYYPASDVIAEDLRYYVKNGVTGGMYQDGPDITSADSDKPLGDSAMSGAEFYDLSAIEFWVVSRLYWNPKEDVEALRDEFCRRAYREAAGPMRKFFATIHQTWQNDPAPCYYSDDPTMAVRRYIVEKQLEKPLRELLLEAEARAVHPGSKELVLRGRRLFEKWLVAEKKLGVRVTLDVPYSAKSASEDLDFNSALWKQAAVIDGFRPMGKPDESPKSVTKVRALHDRKNLYLAFECQEKPEVIQKIKALPAGSSLDDWNALGDIYIEMFFDGDQKAAGSYYQLAFGVNGNRYDGQGYSSTWSKPWSVKTAVDDSAWRAVLTLPLESIGVDITVNQQIGGMLLRGDGTSWQGGNVHQPAGFQTLRLKLD